LGTSVNSYVNWYGNVTAKSTIGGQNSLSYSSEGTLVFTVFISKLVSREGTGGPVVPENSVAGRMTGRFDAQLSTPTRQVTGTGTAEWTIAGTYDPAEETVAVAIRSSGVDAKGTESDLGNAAQGATPGGLPFSTRLIWGFQTRPSMAYTGLRAPGSESPSTILDVITLLDVMKPTVPVIPSKREADLCVVSSLPQTGLTDFQRIVIDLKDPKPQTVIQTFQDEAGFGTRTTTWVFKLIPDFIIERDNRPEEGRFSFVSTDFIGLHIAIPGVTVPKSGWVNLPSWEVNGLGPFSGQVHNQLQRSTTFGFQPSPGTRPTNGSTARNRPIQYTISATIEDFVHYLILTQDDTDLLRQEYIDHNESVVPSRSDCVVRRIDNSFNAGNYNVIIDGGMQAALDKVTVEFGKESKSSVRVVSGFRSPQRNKATGDVHPNNRHVLGRALDLVPDPASAESLMSLYQACVRAGYHSFCEAVPGREVPPSSPDGKHVHIDW
jgi:hypothetical protein